MAVTAEVARLRLESLRRTEPPTEQHVPKARLWDITRVHPHLLPPPTDLAVPENPSLLPDLTFAHLACMVNRVTSPYPDLCS
jgi:hypothetical protein